MYTPDWSCIFTGRWSMVDGLQMWENEPNFDSNIIHTEHTGVEKRQQQNDPRMGFFFLKFYKWCKKRGGSCLGLERIIYPRARSAPTPSHRTAPVQKEKTESCHDSEVAHRLSQDRMKIVRESRRESGRRWRGKNQSVKEVNKKMHTLRCAE